MSAGFATLAYHMIRNEQARTSANRRNRNRKKSNDAALRSGGFQGETTNFGNLSLSGKSLLDTTKSAKSSTDFNTTPAVRLNKTGGVQENVDLNPLQTTNALPKDRGVASKGRGGAARAEAAVDRKKKRDARIKKKKRDRQDAAADERVEDRVAAGESREEAEIAEGVAPGSTDDPQLSITRSDELQNIIDSLGEGFDLQNEDIRGLAGDFEAGFGDLTRSTNEVFDAQKEDFDATRRQTLGTLKEDIARRRISGSSFAADSLGRVTSEFDKRDRALAGQRNTALATSRLQEAEVQQRLFTLANDAIVKKWTSFLEQSNFESGLAAEIRLGIFGISSENERFNAEMRQSKRDQELEIGGNVLTSIIEANKDTDKDT